MPNTRVVSVVLASALVLGSAGMALAAGDQKAAPAPTPAASNPFALDGGGPGTSVYDVTYKADPKAENPFAPDGGGPGTPVSKSHIATPADNARDQAQ